MNNWYWNENISYKTTDKHFQSIYCYCVVSSITFISHTIYQDIDRVPHICPEQSCHIWVQIKLWCHQTCCAHPARWSLCRALASYICMLACEIAIISQLLPWLQTSQNYIEVWSYIYGTYYILHDTTWHVPTQYDRIKHNTTYHNMVKVYI